MTTPVSDFNTAILAYAPNAPDPLVERLLVKVARDFCERTHAWRAELSAMNVVAGAKEIPVTPPTDGVFVEVLSAVYDDRRPPLKPRTRKQLDREVLAWRTKPGLPEFFTEGDALNEFWLAPLPQYSVSGGLVVTAAFKPTKTAAVLDDLLVDLYSEALVNGTLAELLTIPRKPWSDKGLAAYYKALYEEQVVDATAKATDGRMKGVARKTKYGGL